MWFSFNFINILIIGLFAGYDFDPNVGVNNAKQKGSVQTQSSAATQISAKN
jgi:hypothetical protein